MDLRRSIACVCLLIALFAGGCAEPPPEPETAEVVRALPEPSLSSEPQAVEIARATLERMGGWDNWNSTRFVKWKFFGRRLHYWDKWTGDSRIEWESDDGKFVVLQNVTDRQGRAWQDGEPVTEPEALEELLQSGHEMWVNDSYWMFMPYKLLDPGVTLKYAGEVALDDGQPADRLELTFEEVGYTPRNKYLVDVARDSGLVVQWTFFSDADDAEPRFTMPWTGWKQFGSILLATDHGRERDWEIAVFDDLPPAVFDSPELVGS